MNRVMMKELRKHVFVWFLVWALLSYGLVCSPVKEVLGNFPEINLDQVAYMKVVFLGIPSVSVDENEFVARTSVSVSQFAYPNTMTWNLNVSVHFEEFPEDLLESLISGSYRNEAVTYYNTSLLDASLSHHENLAIPNLGYLLVFMWVPDNQATHSWFFVEERPDLFLGRTDYYDGVPVRTWEFPRNFGGRRRAIYFDMSDTMERTPVEAVVTNTASTLFNDAMADIFVSLLGAEDSRMILADNQKYENYEVRMLWLNGTGEEFDTECLEESFEDLMPWTDWTATIETRATDETLNSFISNRTEILSRPLIYSFILSNGSEFILEASRNVQCDLYANSGEHDPLIGYFFDHVGEYFSLADLEDRSIIPVVFLQLANDTVFRRAFQAGVSWFIHNVVIIGFQGSVLTEIGECGQLFLLQILRHEIGHWLSLGHHSSDFASGCPKIVCSMRSMTSSFCAFCKDSRARMSFISHYNSTISLLSQNGVSLDSLQGDLEAALQLFYDWNYVEATNALISIRNRAVVHEYNWWLLVALCVIISAPILFLLVRRLFRQQRRRSETSSETTLVRSVQIADENTVSGLFCSSH